MKTERGIWIGVTGVLVAIILFMKFCNKCPECPPVSGTIVKHDTIEIVKRDTVPHYVPRETKVLVPQWDTQYLPTLINVDTGAIIRDYYTKRFYRDSAETGYGQVYVEDTVFNNLITSRTWQFDLRIPIETIEKTVFVNPPPKGQLYLGVQGLGGSKLFARDTLARPLIGIGPTLTYRTRQDLQIEGSVMYSNYGFIFGGEFKYPIFKR